MKTTAVCEVAPIGTKRKLGIRVRLFITGSTVITEVLLTEPEVAVIVAVPGATPVMVAESVVETVRGRIRLAGDVAITVATEGFELLQVTVFVVAVIVFCCFTESVMALGVTVIDVTGTSGTFTVITQVAVSPRSAVNAVIVAIPPLTAVTCPEEETVATPGLLLVQRTVCVVALLGATVARRMDELPVFS